jgi:cytochrome P450
VSTATQLGGRSPLPGPRLPPIVQSAALGLRRSAFLEGCRRRYGEDFEINLIGQPQLAYLSSRDSIAQLFAASADDARAGEANAPGEAIVGPGSLLLLDGRRHLNERKLLLPSFHGRGVESLLDAVTEATERELASWPADEGGERLRLWPRMKAITLEVILKGIFGISDPARFERLRTTLPATLDVSLLLVFAPRLRIDLGRFNRWGRLRRARAEVDELLFAEIGARRRSDTAEQRDDILSVLLRSRREDGSPLSDDELRDELLTLVLAGHETTATALAWAFERLARHPRVADRLRDLDDPEYLDAVINETLRSRPVVIAAARALHAPLELSGCTLPPGTLAMAGIELAHTARDVYPDADEFRPERWLGDQRPSERYAWIPFGGGTRRCLGAALALAEMRIILPAVVHRFELAPCSPRPEGSKVRAVVCGPARGCEVKVRPLSSR